MAAPGSGATEQFFKPLSADDADETTEVESLCMDCGENGTTKFLLTMIPFYKEVVLSSFSCPHCHNVNNEIQSAGEVLMQGVEFTLRVEDSADLNRQIIKADNASLSIPQLDLEIPPRTQKAQITTIEGILQRVSQGLEQDQVRRKEEHPEDFEKIQDFLDKIKNCQSLKTPFTVVLRDISGQSFICPPPSVLPGQKDVRLQKVHFDRTPEENHLVGYYPELPEEVANEERKNIHKIEEETEPTPEELADEIHQFATICNGCFKDCTTKMKLTKIPHFKEVIIMATDCDHCGERTNEVKSGGGIEEKGRRISLKVTNVDDLCRDVLKAETCSIEIPDLELHVGGGTIGGKFTTLEGLLQSVRDQLTEENPLISGDSAMSGMKMKMEQFCQKLDQLISAEVPFTVILDDPAGNSYLQNIYAPDDDPNMEVVDYERNFDQNEDLGLNDMKVEGELGEVGAQSADEPHAAVAEDATVDKAAGGAKSSSSGESSGGGSGDGNQ